MQVIIENQRQKINLESKTVNIDFDVKKGEYISCVSVKNSYKTKIFSYSDFSLFVCILFKNNCKNLRFVMFNLKKQKAFIVFEVKYSNNLLFKRINETSFLLVEQLKKESVMHLCFFKENKKNNKVLHIGKVKKFVFCKNKKLLCTVFKTIWKKLLFTT